MSSSQVCRWPVALPILDINEVMATIPDFNFLSKHRNNIKSRDLERLLASMKFRLAYKIAINPLGMLHIPESFEKVQKFRSDFSNEMKKEDTKTALLKCNEVCQVSLPTSRIGSSSDPSAAAMLVGIEDKHDLIKQRQLDGVVILPDGTISFSLEKLLTIRDPSISCYSQGRNLFEVMLTSLDEVDLLASTPLERAYLWSLSCQFAVNSEIKFTSNSNYQFYCGKIESGRLFPGDKNDKYNLTNVKENVLYYADERNNKTTHPLADLFFRSVDNEIVLIDIGGGNDGNIADKVNEHKVWIKREQPKRKNKSIKLRSVVIAPNANGKSKHDEDSGVTVVYGDDAIKLLGGLSQIRHWMV
jgi:hypothetical protein